MKVIQLRFYCPLVFMSGNLDTPRKGHFIYFIDLLLFTLQYWIGFAGNSLKSGMELLFYVSDHVVQYYI